MLPLRLGRPAEDEERAVEWFEKAVEEDPGNEVAPCCLRDCYLNGYGVEPDREKAIEYYTEAAERGSDDAVEALEDLGICLDEDEEKEDEEEDCGEDEEDDGIDPITPIRLLPFETLRTPAEKTPEEIYELGNKYLMGNGVQQDHAKAAECYRKAAEKGFAKAVSDLGFCYENGVGLVADRSKAVEWYHKSLTAGYQPALAAILRLGQ